MQKTEVSVIIPVYNSALYLKECLDSLVRQTFPYFEAILVNDGSTDNSGAICEEYCLRDSRIHVIHQNNKGVAEARNKAVELATGNWMCFLDSDDTIELTFLEHLYEQCLKDVDFVMSNTNGERGIGVIKNAMVLEGNVMINYILRNDILSLSGPCAKMFKSKIIQCHNIKFPVGISLGEDMCFLIQYLNHCNRVSFLPINEYNIRSHEGSLTTRYYSFESEMRCFNIWYAEIKKFVNRLNLPVHEEKELIWHNMTGITFIRCLECLYKANHDKELYEKINILSSIDENLYGDFSIYYHPKRLSTKTMKWLVSHRMFPSFLFCGYFYMKMFGK